MSDVIICVSVETPHCYLKVKSCLECRQNLSSENLHLKQKINTKGYIVRLTTEKQSFFPNNLSL